MYIVRVQSQSGKTHLTKLVKEWGFQGESRCAQWETGIFREFVNECRMSNLNETEMNEYKKSITSGKPPYPLIQKPFFPSHNKKKKYLSTYWLPTLYNHSQKIPFSTCSHIFSARGHILEELSRKYAVTMAEINTWRDEFIQNGTDGLKRKPEDSKLSRAERKIGQLEQEIELIMCPTAKRCKKTGLCSPAIHRHNTQPSDNVSDGKNKRNYWRICNLLKLLYFCNSLNN